MLWTQMFEDPDILGSRCFRVPAVWDPDVQVPRVPGPKYLGTQIFEDQMFGDPGVLDTDV